MRQAVPLLNLHAHVFCRHSDSQHRSNAVGSLFKMGVLGCDWPINQLLQRILLEAELGFEAIGLKVKVVSGVAVLQDRQVK